MINILFVVFIVVGDDVVVYSFNKNIRVCCDALIIKANSPHVQTTPSINTIYILLLLAELS